MLIGQQKTHKPHSASDAYEKMLNKTAGEILLQ